MNRLKKYLSTLSFRTGVVVLSLCIPCYIVSFAQFLLPIDAYLKGVLWTVFFGLAKTFQYSGLAILGVEGWFSLKCRFSKKHALRYYVTKVIIPRYDTFDLGHGRSHVEYVINEALSLSKFYDVDKQMIYTAAAYHDLGLEFGREFHHLHSAKIIREDNNLRKWFSEEQINVIADAAEDHRASLSSEPRTIYGKIIAEADRQIVPEVVVKRAIQFGMKHYPSLGKEEQWSRVSEHLKDKYSDSGYLKLWTPESKNAENLNILREIISDDDKLRNLFDLQYDRLINN